MSGAALSELSLFLSRLRLGQGVASSCDDEISIQNEHRLLIRKLFTYRTWMVLAQVKELTLDKVAQLPPDVKKFYEEYVTTDLEKSVAICSAAQHSLRWKKERKFRLNASKAREQYTYLVNKKADWDARYKSVYHSSFIGNADTERGLKDEPLCRDKYSERNSSGTVFESGLLIRPEVPWLGCSLDGTVVDSKGNLVRNVEIKSFKEGTRLTATELLEMNAIASVDQNGNVKVNHAHYAQMQLGMMLSGLDACDYCLWSGLSQDYVAIRVPFDGKHCLELCSRLVHVYFDKFLIKMFEEHSGNGNVSDQSEDDEQDLN